MQNITLVTLHCILVCCIINVEICTASALTLSVRTWVRKNTFLAKISAETCRYLCVFW